MPWGRAWIGIPGDDDHAGGEPRRCGFYTYLHGPVLSNATAKALDALHAEAHRSAQPVGLSQSSREEPFFKNGFDFGRETN